MMSSRDYEQDDNYVKNANLKQVIALIDHDEPIGLIAPWMNVLVSDSAYLHTLYEQSHNWRNLLTIQTARAWPEKYAKAYALFVAQSPYTLDYTIPPCSLRERFIAEILEDRDISKKIRVQFWRALVFDGLRLPRFANGAKWSVPIVLCDHYAIRRWLAINKLDGWEDIICSDPLFFTNDPTQAFKAEDKNGLYDAIDADSVSGFMMPLDISGARLTNVMIRIILQRKAINIATYLYKNKALFRKSISPRTLLFYACANWSNIDCIPFISMLEKDTPGLISSSVDIYGHDALWYTLYNQNEYFMATPEARSRRDTIDLFLTKNGCDPNRKSTIGLSFSDLTD